MDKPFPKSTFINIEVKEILPDKMDASKMTIKDKNDVKYKFKRFKKDGSETKAWAAWKNLVVNPGDVLKIGFYNDVGSFQNEKNETIDYNVNRLTYLEKLDNTVLNDNAGKVPTIVADDSDLPFK